MSSYQSRVCLVRKILLPVLDPSQESSWQSNVSAANVYLERNQNQLEAATAGGCPEATLETLKCKVEKAKTAILKLQSDRHQQFQKLKKQCNEMAGYEWQLKGDRDRNVNAFEFTFCEAVLILAFDRKEREKIFWRSVTRTHETFIWLRNFSSRQPGMYQKCTRRGIFTESELENILSSTAAKRATNDIVHQGAADAAAHLLCNIQNHFIIGSLHTTTAGGKDCLHLTVVTVFFKNDRSLIASAITKNRKSRMGSMMHVYVMPQKSQAKTGAIDRSRAYYLEAKTAGVPAISFYVDSTPTCVTAVWKAFVQLGLNKSQPFSIASAAASGSLAPSPNPGMITGSAGPGVPAGVGVAAVESDDDDLAMESDSECLNVLRDIGSDRSSDRIATGSGDGGAVAESDDADSQADSADSGVCSVTDSDSAYADCDLAQDSSLDLLLFVQDCLLVAGGEMPLKRLKSLLKTSFKDETELVLIEKLKACGTFAVKDDNICFSDSNIASVASAEGSGPAAAAASSTDVAAPLASIFDKERLRVLSLLKYCGGIIRLSALGSILGLGPEFKAFIDALVFTGSYFRVRDGNHDALRLADPDIQDARYWQTNGDVQNDWVLGLLQACEGKIHLSALGLILNLASHQEFKWTVENLIASGRFVRVGELGHAAICIAERIADERRPNCVGADLLSFVENLLKCRNGIVRLSLLGIELRRNSFIDSHARFKDVVDVLTASDRFVKVGVLGCSSIMFASRSGCAVDPSASSDVASAAVPGEAEIANWLKDCDGSIRLSKLGLLVRKSQSLQKFKFKDIVANLIASGRFERFGELGGASLRFSGSGPSE
eukprot:c15964_g1_i2.p1 GENE.c15964_g1_i2~~c15964_g1_i2.p1  ORF type:complete len:832 (+),score=55.06 c15964_g1_i2:648-3143(+)